MSDSGAFQLGLGLLTFAGSWVLTAVLIRFARHRSLLAIPNERSSHQSPTPTGGGMSIAIAAIAALLVSIVLGVATLAQLLGFLTGAVVLSVTGWLDDWFELRSLHRLAIQLLVAAATVILLPLPMIASGMTELLVQIILVLSFVWFINLYNFMDGLDGLAATQTLVACIPAFLFTLMAGDQINSLILLSLAASTAGFLCWNWPPAKIFMGDVGSYMTGFTIAFCVLATTGTGSVPLAAWAILLSAFIVDASLTLARRVLSGEAWYQAHRSHAYQRLNQMGFSHLAISSGFLFWGLVLAALAWLCHRNTSLAWSLVGVVYAASIVFWVYVQKHYSLRMIQSADSRDAH